MNTVVSNTQRKYRATRPDGVSLPKKGNHFSSNTGDRLHVDTKRPFTGQFPYKVSPYVEIDGIFFDDARVLGIVPGAEKPARAPKPERPARKARTARKDPGAGTRPSLSTMRRKG